MDCNALKRSLRTGGWEHHARNLGGFIAEHGLGCTRTHANITLVFDPDPSGNLVAKLMDGRPVADEQAVHLRREQVRVDKRDGDRRLIQAQVSARMDTRIENLCRARGWTRSELLRRASESYLQAMGF